MFGGCQFFSPFFLRSQIFFREDPTKKPGRGWGVIYYYFFFGGGAGGTNERPGTDHVNSGPMRGLKKLNPMAQNHKTTNGHGDSMTELAPWL